MEWLVPPHSAIAAWLFALLLVGIFCLLAREAASPLPA
jgi:hypothetical protein